MTTRALTRDEITLLRSAYCQRERFRPKELAFFLGASLLIISLPVFLLFLFSSHLGHGDSWPVAVRNASYAVGVGPALVLIIYVAMLMQGRNSWSAKICEEISKGVCHLSRHSVKRVWEHIDEGNDDAPDYIAELSSGEAIQIPKQYLGTLSAPSETIELSFLPSTSIRVGIQFEGDPIAPSGRIVTDNVWRNDDQPSLELIPANKLPPEVVAAFRQ